MTRFSPATPVDVSASTAARASPSTAATLYNIIEASDALTDWLEDEQGRRFVQGTDILSVFSEDRFLERPDVQNLPDPQLTYIVGVLENEFRMMYEDCIYQKQTSNTEPERLTRAESWTKRRGRNKPSASGFRIATSNVVSSTTPSGRPVLEVFFDDEASIVFETEEDMTWALDEFNRMLVMQYGEREATLIEDISDIDEQPELEISFRNEPAPKQRVTPDAIESSVTEEHLQSLQNAGNGIDNHDTVGAIDGVMTEGYYTAVEQLEVARFLAGCSPVARLRYFYSVPQIVDQIGRVTGADMAYIPQQDYVILSRNAIPSEITALNERFPEQQSLGCDDVAALNELFDRPSYAIEGRPTLFDRLREQATLTSLVEQGAVNDDELIAYHLTSWHPRPNPDAVYDKIQHGQAIQSALQSLSDNGFTFHNDAIDSVRLAVAPETVETRDDVYPSIRFMPRYLGASLLDFEQFEEEVVNS